MGLFEIVGALAITGLCLWAIGTLLTFAIFCLFGFDEYHPLTGVILLFLAAGMGLIWWLLVGQYIHVHFGP